MDKCEKISIQKYFEKNFTDIKLIKLSEGIKEIFEKLKK